MRFWDCRFRLDCEIGLSIVEILISIAQVWIDWIGLATLARIGVLDHSSDSLCLLIIKISLLFKIVVLIA